MQPTFPSSSRSRHSKLAIGRAQVYFLQVIPTHTGGEKLLANQASCFFYLLLCAVVCSLFSQSSLRSPQEGIDLEFFPAGPWKRSGLSLTSNNNPNRRRETSSDPSCFFYLLLPQGPFHPIGAPMPRLAISYCWIGPL